MATPADQFPRRYRLSVDDYHRMGEVGLLHNNKRTELIDGAVMDMAPIGISMLEWY